MGIGSAVLAGTAAFHASGRAGVAAAVEAADLGSSLAAVVKVLWLFPSFHWLFLALLAAVAVVHGTALGRTVLLLAALLLAIDAALLLVSVGPFLGEALLALSAVAFGLGALLLSPHQGAR